MYFKKLLVKATCWAAAASIVGYGLNTAYADRNDQWLASSVRVQRVTLIKLHDGGCAVQALAFYSKTDGGTVLEESRRAEVAGANRTTCLDIMDNRAPALFRADKDL